MPKQKTFFYDDLPLVRYSEKKTMSKLSPKQLEHWHEVLKALEELKHSNIQVFIVPEPDSVGDVDYRYEYIEQILKAPHDFYNRPHLIVHIMVDKDGRAFPNDKIYIYHSIVTQRYITMLNGKKEPNPNYDQGRNKRLVQETLGRYKWFEWNGKDGRAMFVTL